jgi:hypothetical protein
MYAFLLHQSSLQWRKDNFLKRINTSITRIFPRYETHQNTFANPDIFQKALCSIKRAKFGNTDPCDIPETKLFLTSLHSLTNPGLLSHSMTSMYVE